MTHKMNINRLALALGLCSLASAHDLYLMPESFRVSGTQLIVGVNNGDAFPNSQSAPPMRRLTDGTLHTSKGAVPLQNFS